MALEALARANEKGFDKYNELAQNFMSVIATATALRDNLTVFILMHEEESENIIKGKTLGKLIDNQFTLEGFFDYVIRSTKRKTENGIEYLFETDNANSTCKALAPLPSIMPNDLYNLISVIRSNHGT